MRSIEISYLQPVDHPEMFVFFRIARLAVEDSRCAKLEMPELKSFSRVWNTTDVVSNRHGEKTVVCRYRGRL